MGVLCAFSYDVCVSLTGLPRLGGFNHRGVFSQFLRPEVRSGYQLGRCLVRESSPQTAGGCLLAVCSCGLSLVREHRAGHTYWCVFLLDQGPSFMTSSNLNYPLQTLSLHTVTLGVRASTYEFGGEGGGHNSVHSKFIYFSTNSRSLGFHHTDGKRTPKGSGNHDTEEWKGWNLKPEYWFSGSRVHLVPTPRAAAFQWPLANVSYMLSSTKCQQLCHGLYNIN